MPADQDFDAFDEDNLLFCPLGGSGEIGMNMNLFCVEGRWIMVDCGMTFADDWLPGVDLLFPDPTFIEDRLDQLDAIVLTHGHEDHIGAVPYLYDRLRKPIYATPFTAELVKAKLLEHDLYDMADIRVVPIGGSAKIGPFEVTYVPLAHSIAEGHGLKIKTSLGTLFHTGDWKLDPSPLIGSPSTPEDLSAMGRAGVLAMIGDSTNVFNASESGSEAAVRESLLEVVEGLKGRVVVTTFASNVARLETIAHVARETGRELVCLGRSINRIVSAAKATGYLSDFPKTVDEDNAGYLPRDKVLILCTGCQGEPRAALSRIAAGDHRAIDLDPGDTVIFSSKMIPGNEASVGRLINRLALSKIDVITEKDAFVHVSGHPGRAELKLMYHWIKPQIAIPVHGEARHLLRHAAFAKELGVSQSLAPANGDIIELAPGPVRVVDQAPVGRLALDGHAIVPVMDPGLADRRKVSQEGMISLFLVVSEDGHLLADAQVIARGIAGWDADPRLADGVDAAVEKAVGGLRKRHRQKDTDIAEVARLAARRALRRMTGKNPPVEARVIRLEDEFVD